jgi:hypothetical protein
VSRQQALSEAAWKFNSRLDTRRVCMSQSGDGKADWRLRTELGHVFSASARFMLLLTQHKIPFFSFLSRFFSFLGRGRERKKFVHGLLLILPAKNNFTRREKKIPRYQTLPDVSFLFDVNYESTINLFSSSSPLDVDHS